MPAGTYDVDEVDEGNRIIDPENPLNKSSSSQDLDDDVQQGQGPRHEKIQERVDAEKKSKRTDGSTSSSGSSRSEEGGSSTDDTVAQKAGLLSF